MSRRYSGFYGAKKKRPAIGGGGSIPAPDIQAPGIPGSLTASLVTTSSARLTWNASTGDAVGYRIYRNGVEIGTTDQTQYDLTGLSASTTYTHTVRAYDAVNNESPDSNAAAFTTGAIVGGSITMAVTDYDTVRITFPYAVRARRHASRYVWAENYGITATWVGLNAMVESISASGNELTLRFAGRILPGEAVSVSFVPVQTSPTKTDGSAIPAFSATATYSASFPGAVYYVSSTGNDAAAGTFAAPWRTITKANTVTTVNSTILFKGGETFTGSINPSPGITYANYGTGFAVVDNSATNVYGCIEAIGKNGQQMRFRGFSLKNVHDQYGRNGGHFRNSANAEFSQMYITRATNGLFFRGSGGQYIVKGVELYECSNSGVFTMGEDQATPISNVTLAYCQVHKLLANATVLLNDLFTFHEKYEKIGFLGENFNVYGCHMHNIDAEECLDVTSGRGHRIKDNWTHNCSGDQYVFGWSAKDVHLMYNYMESGLPGELVSTSFVRSRVGELGSIMRFQFNISVGPVLEPVANNGRGAFVFVGSNQDPEENPQNVECSHNLAIFPGNGQTALGTIPFFMQFLSLADRPNPQDLRSRNNLVVTPATGSQVQSLIEFYNPALFTYTSAEYKANNNQYVNSSSVLYKLGGSQVNLATIQAGGKESGSVHNSTQPVFNTTYTYGPYKYRPVATGHGLIAAQVISDGGTTVDYEGYFTGETMPNSGRFVGPIQPRTTYVQ